MILQGFFCIFHLLYICSPVAVSVTKASNWVAVMCWDVWSTYRRQSWDHRLSPTPTPHFQITKVFNSNIETKDSTLKPGKLKLQPQLLCTSCRIRTGSRTWTSTYPQQPPGRSGGRPAAACPSYCESAAPLKKVGDVLKNSGGHLTSFFDKVSSFYFLHGKNILKWQNIYADTNNRIAYLPYKCEPMWFYQVSCGLIMQFGFLQKLCP